MNSIFYFLTANFFYKPIIVFYNTSEYQCEYHSMYFLLSFARCFATYTFVVKTMFAYFLAFCLLDNGADINERTTGNATPLILATIYNQSLLIQFLLDKGNNHSKNCLITLCTVFQRLLFFVEAK